MADSDTAPHCRINAADWTTFRPDSATQRLIENGFIVKLPTHFDSERVGGWLRTRTTEAYSAPVVRLDAADGHPLDAEAGEGLDLDAALTVHYPDPRVRQLAEARWRMSTGRSRGEWLALGKDHPETQIEEARAWLRAAVATGLLPPPAGSPHQSRERHTPGHQGSLEPGNQGSQETEER